jgi:hypothetical protein
MRCTVDGLTRASRRETCTELIELAEIDADRADGGG